MNDVIGILGAALMGFSSMAGSYELLIVGRLVIGYNCGQWRTLRQPWPRPDPDPRTAPLRRLQLQSV